MLLLTVCTLLLAPMLLSSAQTSGGDSGSCKHVTNNQNITVVAPTGQKGDKGDPGPSGYCGTKGDMRPSCPPVVVFSAARTLASSGKFVAPVAGIYSFTFNGMTRSVTSASYWIALIQNDLPRATLSNTVILQLAAGDQVFVELRQGKYLNSNFNRHVTFSGTDSNALISICAGTMGQPAGNSARVKLGWPPMDEPIDGELIVWQDDEKEEGH
ncbi:positive regulation of adiponectin secretion [Branchiostoma belcheri]|nr:positive regulation of adiponectin secretion [Branchiostoma belcheri]